MDSKNILVILGSPRKDGYSTYLARQCIDQLEKEHTNVEVIRLYDMNIKACIACDSCRKPNSNFCILNDDMKPLYKKIIDCDGLVLAFPIYWFSINAQMKLFIDRFYAMAPWKTKVLKDKKVGAIIVYGDGDPYISGAVNAIRSLQDTFNYTESKLCKVVYSTEIAEENRGNDEKMGKEIMGLATAMISGE